MNLLPKSHQDFREKEYWNTFFTKRGKKAFEWYGEYTELCGLLHKYIKHKDDILEIGCGNSNLGADLYNVGFRNITSIDISQVVIKQMQKQRADMNYMHMDALNMTFENEKFSVVLDKGTVDALMPNDSPHTLQQIEKLFSEVNRVLRTGGRFICVSLLQTHILKQFLAYFPKTNWMLRVVRCHEAEESAAKGSDSAMPVFVVICTKFKNLPIMILEMCLVGEKMQRLDTQDELLSAIKSIQKTALICSGLQKTNICELDEISFDLFESDKNIVRFTIFLLEQSPSERNKKQQYAAFIVPQGRETEWLFGTRTGRRKLLRTVQFNRLAVVTLHRGQHYSNLECIKEELKHSIRQFAPAHLTDQIPFLSVGEDIGNRETLFEGVSEISGRIVVEDFTGGNGQIYRRLIFLNNQNIVQSEAKLKTIKGRRGKCKTVIEPLFLACEHHTVMSVGSQCACTGPPAHIDKNVLVLGLGGGGLCTFLSHSLSPNVCISAVDIDAAILDVAINWFGLVLDKRLQVFIEDGLKFLQDAALNNLKYDAILFDVDSKDTSLGMSCPPSNFLELNVLENVHKCISDKGIFIINLVLGDESLRKSIIESLKSKFDTIASYRLEEDLNEILFCKKYESYENLVDGLKAAASTLNNAVKKKRKSIADDIIQVEDFMKTLQLCE